MTWWAWMLVGAAAGAVLAVVLSNELRLYARIGRRPRAITIDLVGAGMRDPDDWFDQHPIVKAGKRA